MFWVNSVAYVAGHAVKAMERSSRMFDEYVDCLVDSEEVKISSDPTELVELKNSGGQVPTSR